MADQQITAELTVRDVLGQVDRRLTLIEGDLRDLRPVLDAQTAGLRNEMNAQTAGFRNEMNGLRNEMSVKFRWLTGIVLASWLSIMGTLLLK